MPERPTFREALRFWLKLGFISFGGPTGQIAIMHTELVDRRKWIGEQQFLHALNYCMLLPGPEATQLATYCGWLLHGTRGGIVAGALFVLPSVVLLWALSWIYVAYGTLPWLAAIFHGLQPAVTAIVAFAVIRIGQRVLKSAGLWALASGAFVAIFFFKVPFPAIIAGAAVMGFLSMPSQVRTVLGGPTSVSAERPGRSRALHEGDADSTRSGPPKGAAWLRATKVLAVSLILWWTPVFLAAAWQGWNSTVVREGIFFSKAAMVTFGGAYAVLPYVGQRAVEYGWLTAPQMLDGLGLAETTPGPLIMVVQFVGFLGGWNQPGALNPLAAATLGAALTTWTTFVPCFLWIFLGAPHIEQLRGNVRLESALTAVTASVVGVVLNLAVWFALHVFLPAHRAVDWFAIVVATAAFVALQRFKVGVIPIVMFGGFLGWAWSLVRL